ncbi:methyltransferase [uncultured Nonlabens sp.]|uniref:THUMP-like domain-containing protein n=1 Tax=uncultured Nonlabens sp. TaxID=859306 RepID=UPI0026152B1C|nr:methyltransferase [uncultured Nonlabens sp.]
MNLKVILPEVTEYLRSCLHENAAAFMLKKHPFNEVTTLELTQQLIGLQKARSKFLSFFENDQIIYPPKVNLEQTSSQATAVYKSQISKIDSMIDLTGGFGVDVSAFAKACPTTTHVELSSQLQEYAQHSFKVQGLQIKSYCADGLQFLKENSSQYDLIYIDPSRKTASHSKAVLLKDYEPNVVENLEFLLKKGKQIMIKTSPMLDITAGLQQLEYVRSLHIVAVKNEVKELLWILTKEQVGTPVVKCVNLLTEQPVFESVIKYKSIGRYSRPLKYLYEPNAAVMKSQEFDAILEQYPLLKLDQDAHLFTSEHLIEFPGRAFEIKSVNDNKPKKIKRLYGKSARGVVTRNHKESVAQLRKKYQFSEHETDYLFFTSSEELGSIVIEVIKL